MVLSFRGIDCGIYTFLSSSAGFQMMNDEDAFDKPIFASTFSTLLIHHATTCRRYISSPWPESRVCVRVNEHCQWQAITLPNQRSHTDGAVERRPRPVQAGDGTNM